MSIGFPSEMSAQPIYGKDTKQSFSTNLSVGQHNTVEVDSTAARCRILLASMVPPRNDGGSQLLMHRHLVERNPFELHVASSADYAQDLLVHTRLRLPYLVHRLRKSRFGPRLARWVADYQNLVWSRTIPRELDKAILDFKPSAIITLAETGVCHQAANAAKWHKLPLVGWFHDWFPIVKGFYGHACTRTWLSQRFRKLYRQCDLALCISEGMRNALGSHPNSHVIYPISGTYKIPEKIHPPRSGKFRLAYVGSVQFFYGQMICSLIEKLESVADIEFLVVGPRPDWSAKALNHARNKGIYLGFKPPEQAAEVLAGADVLLVVMSFEPQYRLFMETSFTTKFADYTSFGKPIIFWGPEYCAPVQLVRHKGGAWVVNQPDADGVVAACRKIAAEPLIGEKLALEAKSLRQGLFNQERLQSMFVSVIQKLIERKQAK
jgi:glycosyltransferase involved in cell wall biosynthesis